MSQFQSPMPAAFNRRPELLLARPESVERLRELRFRALPLGDVDVHAERPDDFLVQPDRGEDVVKLAHLAARLVRDVARHDLAGEGAPIVRQPCVEDRRRDVQVLGRL